MAAGLLKNKMDKENIQKRGKRACLWCENVAGFECGNLRTLGSLDYWYERYITENNSKKSNMKDFMNVIKPRLLYTEDDPNTLLQP